MSSNSYGVIMGLNLQSGHIFVFRGFNLIIEIG